jgi:hypothetical protein
VINSIDDFGLTCLYAAHDPRVVGMYLEINRLDCGYSKVDELVRWLKYLQQADKPVIGSASLSAATSEKEYYLSRACSAFYLSPISRLDLRGFSASSSFYRGLLDQLRIDDDDCILHVLIELLIVVTGTGVAGAEHDCERDIIGIVFGRAD